MSNERKAQIQALISEAADKLEEARVLSEGLERESQSSWTKYESFYYDGPEYGMGGSLSNGEWSASSGSC